MHELEETGDHGIRVGHLQLCSLGGLFRQQSDAFDEHERLVFMNRKMNQERTDCTMADLKSQCRQAIKRLAKFKGSAHKSMTNSTGRSHEGTGTALLARLLIQAPELL